jgi:sulfite exporter TauE/SafE
MEFWTAFVLGLAGSVHCAGMCGALALALPAPSRRVPAFLAGRLAYNGGRVLTYSCLGLVFGSMGRVFAVAGFQQTLSITLGIALLVGLIISPAAARFSPVTRWVELLKRRMSALLRQRSLTTLGILGILNGLLPCGLVYVACAGAAATAHSLQGAQFMAVFGLGTVPMMLAISLSGSLVSVRVRLKLARAVPVVVGLLATLLILRGMSLGIPYLSPNLSGGETAVPVCHGE